MRSSRRVALASAAGVCLALLAGCAILPDRGAVETPTAATLTRDRIAELSERSDEALAELVPATLPDAPRRSAWMAR